MRPHSRIEKDRDNNGKIDSFEETYNLDDNVTLKTAERIDEKSGETQVRITMLLLQGTPFWSEWKLSDSSVFTFVERRCPYGLGFSGSSLTVFDKDRKMIAALKRAQNGRFIPDPDVELGLANEMVDGLAELMEQHEKEAVDDAQREAE